MSHRDRDRRPWDRDRRQDPQHRDYRREDRGYRGPPQRRDWDQRIGRVDRQISREVSIREGELKPMPDGKKCNPLCPYFKCTKKALGVVRRDIDGRPKFVGYCNWVNDLCIGGICQFSSCEKYYLLPNGTCLYAVERYRKSGADDMLKEMEKEEKEARRLRDLISRKLGGRGYDLE